MTTTLKSRVEKLIRAACASRVGQRSPDGCDPVSQLAVLAGGSDRDGHLRPQLEALGPDAATVEPGAERAAHHREDDVVDRGSESVHDQLEMSEVGAHPLEAPVGADRDVEGHVRRRVGERPAELADALEGLGDPRQRVLGVLDAPLDAAGQAERRLRELLDPARHHRRARRLRIGNPRLVCLDGLGHRLKVEQHRGDVDSRHTVDEGVVRLRQQREALAGQALHQPQLPQRLRAVELLGEDPAGHSPQLFLRAGRRQRRVPDVVLEVEGRVVGPERSAVLRRRVGQLLPEPGDEVEP